MRAFSHVEQLHEHTHDDAGACGEYHSPARVQLVQTFIGLTFIINSFIGERFSAVDSNMGGYSAMIGAFILGFPIVRVALENLRGGTFNTNVLVALAVLALFGSGHCQEAGIVSFFMLLGQIIETRTAEGALTSIHSLSKPTPTRAPRVTGSEEQEVAVHELTVGDIIRVRPGDNVAADGVIISGQGSFNQANITGESLPVAKTPEEEVFAGTINQEFVRQMRAKGCRVAVIGIIARLLGWQILAGHGHGELAVLHAFGGNQFIGDFADYPRLAAHEQYFQAIVMVQVHVNR